MINVLLVQGSAELAGAERVLLALLRHLDRDRTRPVVAFLADGPVVDLVVEADVEVRRLAPVGRVRDFRNARAVVGALEEEIRTTGSHLVQATGEKMALYASVAARRAHRPSVAWLHDSPASRHEPAAALVQAVLALAPTSSVITCSRWLADAFNRRLRLGATAIPNGIELDRLPTPTSGRSRLLAAADFPGDAVVLGHVGRLEAWKGADVFLRAAAEVRDPMARFAVVGGALFGRDQAYARSLPALAAELGLGDRVWFSGHRDDALELMSGMDAVVHCSTRADPFPTVVLEGMALGRVIVATRTRGPEEAITHDTTGLLVSPGDAGELAAVLGDILRRPDQRRRLGTAARRHAVERFDAARMAQEFQTHWCALVDRTARP